mmetsp:Transcript_38/g.81  ORF Transcript_38/g.81 Transcript_38/m.81 type:complete len:208 (-) Transcript_38:180-803(-)
MFISSRFLLRISSLSCSNWCFASESRPSSSVSMASIMAASSFFSCLNLPTIDSFSLLKSICRVFNSWWKLRSSAYRRLSCSLIKVSRFTRWVRRAIWYWSSASSRSRSSICRMASFLSTSLSWFWDRISMSFFSASAFAMRMIFLHWFVIFRLFTREILASSSILRRSSALASVCCCWRSSAIFPSSSFGFSAFLPPFLGPMVYGFM